MFFSPLALQGFPATAFTLIRSTLPGAPKSGALWQVGIASMLYTIDDSALHHA